MIGSFKFNDVESSTHKLVCKSVKRPLLPAMKSSTVEIFGTSGIYDFGENEYSLRTITMKIAYIGTSYEELRTRARSIAAWLSTSTWAKLVLNDENDKYYLAKITSEIDLESLWGSGTADVTFDCQPFAYSVNESTFSFSGAGSHQFTCPGTRKIDYKSPQGSKSIITVSGSWSTLSLSMNGKTLNYNGSGSTFVVDNVNMSVTNNGINAFHSLSGDMDHFLPINPGSNTLTVSGSGLSATININVIPMWM